MNEYQRVGDGDLNLRPNEVSLGAIANTRTFHSFQDPLRQLADMHDDGSALPANDWPHISLQLWVVIYWPTRRVHSVGRGRSDARREKRDQGVREETR
jgi:hypothetical protein